MPPPFEIAKNASHQTWLNVGSEDHLDKEPSYRAGYGDNMPVIPVLGRPASAVS